MFTFGLLGPTRIQRVLYSVLCALGCVAFLYVSFCAGHTPGPGQKEFSFWLSFLGFVFGGKALDFLLSLWRQSQHGYRLGHAWTAFALWWWAVIHTSMLPIIADVLPGGIVRIPQILTTLSIGVSLLVALLVARLTGRLTNPEL